MQNEKAVIQQNKLKLFILNQRLLSKATGSFFTVRIASPRRIPLCTRYSIDRPALNYQKKPCSRTGSAELLLCTIQCSFCAFHTVIMPSWPFSACWAFLLPLENLSASKIFREIFKKAGRIGCFRCHISGKGKIHPTSPRKGGEKMAPIPCNDGEQRRFDAFCKTVLRNEARNYHRNKKRLLDH